MLRPRAGSLWAGGPILRPPIDCRGVRPRTLLGVTVLILSARHCGTDSDARKDALLCRMLLAVWLCFADRTIVANRGCRVTASVVAGAPKGVS